MTVYYRELRDTEDSLTRQTDIDRSSPAPRPPPHPERSIRIPTPRDRLGCWAKKIWKAILVKCNRLYADNQEENKKVKASYTFDGMVLENVDSSN